jgi:hypothetical protein
MYMAERWDQLAVENTAIKPASFPRAPFSIRREGLFVIGAKSQRGRFTLG